MRFEYPTAGTVKALRELWKRCFGDTDDFLDVFFSTGFAPERCRCAMDGDALTAALYWLDCRYQGRKLAYIYAVATDLAYRGQGICHALMADTHDLLRRLGYAGALLVPGSDGLWGFYGAMGYVPCAGLSTVSTEAGAPVALEQITPRAYAQRRREQLPQGGVIQEGAALAFLAAQCRFYAGDRCLVAARREGERLFAYELLGDIAAAPGVVAALGASEGELRCPGEAQRYAMYLPLDDDGMPRYFAFGFDR